MLITPQIAIPMVRVTPIFSNGQHERWSADCPHCNAVWESPDAYTNADIVECNTCKKEYKLSYSQYESDY